MANSSQLSKNNQNAQVWANWDINTEASFKSCINNVYSEIKGIYSDFDFVHSSKVTNQTLIESFNNYAPTHATTLNGVNGGGSTPDGGIIYVKCKDASLMPVFIGENKHQEDNPGNAIERSLKNISFFKNLLISENYFPYLLNINGPIVNDRKGSLFDRIAQDGGFMPVNKVYVTNDPATPRLRPFTIILDKSFDFKKVKGMSLEIIDKSIEYLKNNDNIFAVTLFNVEPNGCHNIISESFIFNKYEFPEYYKI